jgi:putative endonuclease
MIDIYYVKIFVSSMTMRNRTELAFTGESLAASFLGKKGYEILKRNYRSKYGEIDIIAYDKTELVFVEVKTRTGCFYRNAEESVTTTKQKKLTKTAYKFIQEFEQYKILSCRFDVIVILYNSHSDTFCIKQIVNAFLPSDIN